MKLSVALVKEEAKGLVELVATLIGRTLIPLRYVFTKATGPTVLYVSHKGLRTDCNPRAIYDYLHENYPGKFHHVWAVKDLDKWSELAERSDTELCKIYSPRFIRYSYLSHVVISNTSSMPAFPGNKNQIWIGTWHGGGCYKHFANGLSSIGPFHRAYLILQAKYSTYYISSSKFFTEHVLLEDMLYSGNILPWGMPRNDRLVNAGARTDPDIRKRLGIEEGQILVTYAPTWLPSGDGLIKLDVEALREVVRARFDREPVIACRAHHRYSIASAGFDLNLSKVEDVQDVLAASDMLISDYSSIIWDFSFTYRPCFLFTPNLAEYTAEFGFFKDIHEWGFPVCEDMSALKAAILNFNVDTFKSAMCSHHDDLESYESGTATEKVCELIVRTCF